MRKEPFTVDNYVHVLNRGTKKLPVVRDKHDRWRFLKILCHLNDAHVSEHWIDEVDTNVKNGANLFDRPFLWQEKRPLVSILAYTLMPNHFHLLLKEITPGGVGKFMQKLGNSMTGHFNLKYNEQGSIFQGSYKAKRVEQNEYLRYLVAYIMVKNVFELYPGGLARAVTEFDKAFFWAQKYEFSSFADYASAEVRPPRIILNKEIVGDMFSSPIEFKKFAQEFMVGQAFKSPEVQSLFLE